MLESLFNKGPAVTLLERDSNTGVFLLNSLLALVPCYL